MLKYLTVAFAAIFAFPSQSIAAVEIGKLAPNFTGKDIHGKSVSLDDYRGKTVVLEWNNPECPFVVKHYSSNNMQKLQKDAVDDGAIWLSINSSGKGKQGYLTPEQAQASYKEKGLASTSYLLDPAGAIGKLYDAKTTPHVFIVDKEGLLAYQGAIDSKPSFDPKDIEGAENLSLIHI